MRKSYRIKIVLFVCAFTLFGIPVLHNTCLAAWNYDWNTKTDPNGMVAGIFEATPFPLDENMTTYSITNDEGTKTYNLGATYFVDNEASGCSNGSTNYSPTTRSCGSGSRTVYTTIKNAILAVSSGNKTILIRSGTYLENAIKPKNGTDNTHRYILSGYKQERPVIDGGNSTSDIITGTGLTNAFTTIQRVKLQNSKNQGVRIGNLTSKLDGYFNLIDVWVYNCNNDSTIVDDGNIYYMNVDNGWLYHVSSEHSYNHCMKIGDGGDNNIVEWSAAKECGYWDGFPKTSYYNMHAMGIDVPNVSGYSSDNIKLRYNVIKDVLFYGIYLRGAPNFSVHHNEVTKASRCYSQMSDPASSCDNHSQGNYQATIMTLSNITSGNWYSNLIHDGGATGTGGFNVWTINTGTPTVNFYNNILYGHGGPAVNIRSDNTALTMKIMNNSIYQSTTGPLIKNDIGSKTSITNNILYQGGSGSCVSIGTAPHTYNLFYYPNGSRGVTLSTGEADGIVNSLLLPSGAYNPLALKLNENKTGANLSSIFSSDMNNVSRVYWTIGAYEFGSLEPTQNQSLAPPQNLRII